MRWCSLVVAVFLLLGLSGNCQDFSRPNERPESMPNLLDQPEEKARQGLPKGTKFRVVGVVSEREPGKVVRTVPAAGVGRPKNGVVTLFVSARAKTSQPGEGERRETKPEDQVPSGTPWSLYLSLQTLALAFFGFLWYWKTKPEAVQAWFTRED